MLDFMTYERTMMAATAMSYVGGIVANRKLKPWIERHTGGVMLIGLAAITWWIPPTYAVAKYSVRSVCDEASMRLNAVPKACGSATSDSVLKSLAAFTFEQGGAAAKRLFRDGLPQLSDADFDGGSDHKGVLQPDEMKKIQRAVLRDSPGYYTIADETERARIWNRVVKEMGKDGKYLRDESDVVAEDAR